VSYIAALSFAVRIAVGGETSTVVPMKRSRASLRASRSNEDWGRTTSTFSRRTMSSTASAKEGSRPGGTT
jgi:hypothetical protein